MRNKIFFMIKTVYYVDSTIFYFTDAQQLGHGMLLNNMLA